ENLGFIQFRLNSSGYFEDLNCTWVNTTLRNFYQLAEVDAGEFLTPEGKDIKKFMQQRSDELGLGDLLGCSPQLYDPAVPLSNDSSFYRLLLDEIVPRVVVHSELASKNEQFFVTNTAALRYKMFPGPVTRNDLFTIAPF